LSLERRSFCNQKVIFKTRNHSSAFSLIGSDEAARALVRDFVHFDCDFAVDFAAGRGKFPRTTRIARHQRASKLLWIEFEDCREAILSG
jgi:hypothetical protein